jgi:hypothetical protein
MHYVLMGIMKENSYSRIQRHWFCQIELNKQFALSKTTYKLVRCDLSNHPWTIIKKYLSQTYTDRMHLLIMFGSITEAYRM